MSWNGWDTNTNGDIAVFPVTGWSTATFMKGMAGGLRLEIATDPALTDRAALQVILSRPQARELSQALVRLADQLAAGPSADGPQGPPS